MGKTFPSVSLRYRSLAIGLWELFAGSRRAIALCMLVLAIATILSVAPAALTKLIIDSLLVSSSPASFSRVIPGDRIEQLYLLGFAVGVVAILELALRLVGRWYINQVAIQAHLRLKRRLFQHLINLPFTDIQRLKIGGAVNILRDDQFHFPEFAIGLFYESWRSAVRVVGSLIILLVVDWRLLVGMLFLAPLFYWNHRNWTRRIRPMHADLAEHRQRSDAHIAELFNGLRVVRAFGQARAEEKRFVRRQHLLARMSLNLSRARTVESVWEGVAVLGSLTVLVYGGTRVIQGQLSVGDLMMFLGCLALLLGPIEQLANSASALQRSAAGLERILQLLGQPTARVETTAQVPLVRAEVRGEITLRGVRFRYPHAATDALKNINLRVDPGEIVALVGCSGAGKSTLCNLVARFYECTDGSIELDGRDIRQLPVDQYRSLFGIVEQDVFLFEGTIAENIAYGQPRADRAAIIAAAQAAHLHEFICETEHGYETVVGERGQRLSGGQRQRLAIARALLVQPKILILDEATSSLDDTHETAIRQSLKTLLRGRTCFVIAHRQSTIQLAHRIIRLDHGRIVAIEAPSALRVHQPFLAADSRAPNRWQRAA